MTAAQGGRTERLTGAQAMLRVLRASNVTDYFGIVGGNLREIFQALQADTDARYTAVRHEAAGAFAAAAVYNSTGRLAVALAELGPGTVNLVGGLGMAHNNNLPVLAITSAFSDARTSPLIGSMMELDGPLATAAVTKWRTRVARVDRITSLTRWAIREALSGRPGPVHLDIPAAVLAEEHDFSSAELDAPLEHFAAGGRTPADAEQVAKAARLVAEGSRILLLAGGGVVHSDATEEFRALARRLGAAATGTQMAIGVVDTTAPDFIGHAGAIGGRPVVRAMAEADVVIAAGCKFGSWVRSGTDSLMPGWPSQSIIQIDTDPTAIGRAQPVAVGLVGDAKAILRQLADAITETAASDPDWLASLVRDQRTRREGLERLARSEPLHPAAIATEIGLAVPDDGLVVYDGGHTSFWTNDLTPASRPRTRFNDSGMAQLGFGLPFALGLSRVHPGRTVFNVTGDGSFGFTVGELDTARRHGLPVITIIHNNASWGVIEAGYRTAGIELGTGLDGTDYAAIARGFGCFGERVTERDQIRPAIQRAIDSGLPAVLDVRTRFDRHPDSAYFGATLA